MAPARPRLWFRLRPMLACLSLVLAGLAAAPCPRPALAQDALYDKVFGQRRQNRMRQLDLPVLLEGREIGLVAARLSGKAQGNQLNLSSLAGLLAPLVQEGALDALRGAADGDGFGDPDALPADGITARINTADLNVELAVPPALRQMQTLNAQQRGVLPPGQTALPPAGFSAYANMRGAVTHREGADGDSGRGPFSVLFEPAVNWRGLVLEGEAAWREDGEERRWTRGPTRLLYDLPDSALRLAAGDIATPVDGQQVGRLLGGIGISRNFALQPYRSVQPSGQQEFILEAPSTVDVFVNGRQAQTYRLGPGPYQLSNLPGVSGANDVVIRITDVFGRQRDISFPFFFDSQLLAPGVNEFAWSLGYPYLNDGSRITYDTDQPTLSGFHRLGVADWLTLGLGAQWDRNQRNLSGEILFTSTVGTMVLEPAASLAGEDGFALGAGYRIFSRGETPLTQRSLTAQVNWRDSAYAAFGTLEPRNEIAWDASLRYSQGLTEDLSASLGGRWRESRVERFQDSYSADLSLRQRIGIGSSLDATLSHDRGADGRISTGLFVSLRFNIGEGRQTAGLSHDTLDRESRVDWRYQSPGTVETLNLALEGAVRPGPDRLQMNAGYVHSRFQTSFRHDVTARERDGRERPDTRSQWNLSTALAFADGHLGISRPISNSFALVVPHPRLRGMKVGVDPRPGLTGYLAESDWLGPPVIPNLSAYLVRPVVLDVPEAPLGYDLGVDRPAVIPGYRTGSLIPIGTNAAVSLGGTLLAPDGTPVQLLSGELRPVGADADSRTVVQFFTNRRGRFRIEGVRPGDWAMVLFGLDHRPHPLTVAADAEGLLMLDEVRLLPP